MSLIPHALVPSYICGMATSLTRRISFSAAHHYRVAAWSDEQNEAAFGALGRSHAHAYTCDVTVIGPADPQTGFVVDLAAFDHVLRTEVLDRLDGRDINRDIPEFADGVQLPSCENVARFIGERVRLALAAPAQVLRVVVAEDATLYATWEA